MVHNLNSMLVPTQGYGDYIFSEMTDEMEQQKKLGPAVYTLSHLMVDDKFQKEFHWHT